MAQCQCLTKKGERCKNRVQSGTRFCFRHLKCNYPVSPSESIKSQQPDFIDTTLESIENSDSDQLSTRLGQLMTIARKRSLHLVNPDVLTVSAYTNFYPICYKSNGEIVGLDVDILTRFCQFADLNLELVESPKFDGIWDHPAQGLSDTSIGGIGISDQRTAEQTVWTIPYFYVQRTIVYHRRDPIKDFPKDVTGTILATPGSTGYIDAEKKMAHAKKSKLFEAGTTDTEDLNKLRARKIQGLARGSFVGRALVQKYPELNMVDPWDINPELVATDGEVFAYPCSKDSGLVVLLTEFLTIELLSGHLEGLLKKYDLV